MALKSTVFKAVLQLSDLDREYYNEFNLTIAQHPSETDERMMIRLLLFALHADEELKFTKGLCVEEEPELWIKNLSSEVELRIEMGTPDEKRIKKACNQAKEVYLYTYGGGARIWWEKQKDKLSRYQNLKVLNLRQEETQSLPILSKRTMNLQCTIQDGQVWFGDEENNVVITPEFLQS